MKLWEAEKERGEALVRWGQVCRLTLFTPSCRAF
jgi:hypothetical protein